MLVSQTFRGSPELQKEGYLLLQKWYMLTNMQKHRIIKSVADALRNDQGGHSIRDILKNEINRAVLDSSLPSY